MQSLRAHKIKQGTPTNHPLCTRALYLCIVSGVTEPAMKYGKPLGEELHVEDAGHVQWRK